MSAPLVEVVIAGNAESYTASINSAASTTEEAVGKLDGASKDLSGSFDSSSESAGKLAGGITDVGGSASDAAGMVGGASDSIKASLADILPQVSDLDDTFSKVGEAFDGSAEQVSIDTTLMMADIDKLLESNDKLIESIDKTGGTVEEVSTSSDGWLSTIGDMLEKLEGKFGIVGEAAGKMGASIKESAGAADASLEETDAAVDTTAGGMSTIGKAGIAGIAVVAIAAVDLGAKYQALTTNIAAYGGISVKAAGDITNAFLGTAGSTIYSGKQIATAYGGVVGQLTAVQGHALDSKEAMQVMGAAMDLAEGSGESLGSATSALSNILQTYHEKSNDAVSASDALFSTAKDTGTSITAVANSVKQAHTQLGALTPPLQQTGALMVDMVEQGMNGSRALRSLGSSLNSLMKPSENVINDQQNLKTTFDELPPSLQKLATQVEKGTISSKDLSTATQGLSTTQADLFSHFTAANTAVSSATLKLKESGDSALFVNGKFVGLGSAIGILHNQVAGLSPQAQLARLAQDGLGSSAAKLLPIIDAGSKAWDKASSEVGKAGAAHEAAAKQSQTLDHQLETLKSSTEDEVTALGVKLIPVVTEVAKIFVDFTNFLMHNKEILIALGVIVGGIVVMALYAMAVAAADAAIAFIGLTAPALAIIAAIALVAAAAYELYEHWGTVWGGIKKVAEDVWHFLDDDIIHPIADAFTWVINEIKSHWQLLLGILLAPFAPVIAVVAAFHDQIIHFFEDIPHYVSDVVNAIVGFFTAMPGKILSGLGDIVGFIFGPLLAAGEWINDNVVSPVVEYFVSLPGKLLSALGSIVSFVFGPLLAAQVWILNNVINPVLNYFRQLPSRILSGFGDIVGTIFSGLLDVGGWVNSNVIGPVLGVFTGLPAKIISAFGDVNNILLGVGEDIIKGLINGITNMTGAIGSALGDVASKIKSFITNPLGIFSPSTVFHGYGENLMQGLANGITANASLVHSAIGGVSSSLATGFGAGGISAAAAGAGAGAGAAPVSGGSTTIVLSIDGARFAQAILNPLQTASLLNQKTGGTFNLDLN